MGKAKILIVDDNFTIRKLLESALKDEFHLSLAQDGEEALAQVISFSPDLIILDIMLPDMSGYEVCTQVKANKSSSKTPIIMLSAKTGSTARSTGYNLGAINYVEKPFEIPELKSIIRSTLKGKNEETSELVKVGDLEIDLLRHIVSVKGESISLTSSEFKLISYFAKRPNEVLSREALLSVLSPDNLEITDRTIDNHVSTLRKKLETSMATIKTIYSEGYKLIP